MGPHLRLLMEPSLPLLILVPINVIIVSIIIVSIIIVSMIMIIVTYITHQGSMIMITHQGSTTLGRLSEDLVSRVLFCWENR